MTDFSCSVCGEPVQGTPFVDFGIFAAVNADGSAAIRHPDKPPADFDDWRELFGHTLVHDSCIQMFLDGSRAQHGG